MITQPLVPSTNIRMMATPKVTAVILEMRLVDPNTGEVLTISATGDAKRHPTDTNKPKLGATLALARACHALSIKMSEAVLDALEPEYKDKLLARYE